MFRHAIPLRGDRKGLTFTVGNGKLPEGVTLEVKTGLMSGRTSTSTSPSTYLSTVRAENACGAAERAMTLVIGDDARGQCLMMGWASWNTHTYFVNAEPVRRAAHALVDSGIAARGYE